MTKRQSAAVIQAHREEVERKADQISTEVMRGRITWLQVLDRAGQDTEGLLHDSLIEVEACRVLVAE